MDCSFIHSFGNNLLNAQSMSGFPGGANSKEPVCNAGNIRDAGSIPGLGRHPGGGNGNLLQYSCLENPMDRGAWWAMVHGVTKSWTWLKWLSTMSKEQYAENSVPGALSTLISVESNHTKVLFFINITVWTTFKIIENDFCCLLLPFIPPLFPM